MASRSWHVRGIEPSATAAEHARGLGFDVHTGSIDTAPEPSVPYDLTVGWMVLEHLHEPVAALRKLAASTRPGGWLAVSVPNAASWELRTFGSYWYALDLPRHLYHFTPATIQLLLAEAGWQERRILFQRSLDNGVAGLGYCLADSGGVSLRPRLGHRE